MIRLKLLAMGLFMLLTGVFGQTQKTVKAKLAKATVYLQGAHLYYTEQVLLKAGYNELVFENISPQLLSSSLQASSKGGLVVDVKYKLHYHERKIVKGRYDQELERVADSITEINFLLKEVENKSRVLVTEKQMLLGHKVIKGQSDKDSLPLLKEGMAFLREKLNNIYELELKLERQQSRLQKTKGQLITRQSLLQQLQSGEANEEGDLAKPIPQVYISMFSENAGLAQVNFNYFVAAAHWIPLYDLQASSATNNLQLKFMANVSQQSGINWVGVPLTLSTSNPQEGNTKPELNPWYVSFIAQRKSPMVQYQQNSLLEVESISAVPSTTRAEAKKAKALNSSQVADEMTMDSYLTVTENILRTEYEIKLNYTIESDGQPHRVMINQKEVPMQLQFAAVPKLCTDAFLMANITNWEDMNILPGNARLFFDESFVGDVYLNALTTSDTLSVNLGRDKLIAITRKKVKDKAKSKLFESEKVETRTIEVVVRNTKGSDVEVLLEDQVPVPNGTTEIKVNVLNADGASYDELTGKLTWRVKIGSKETKKIQFTYEIRYPKDKVVYGL